MMERDSPWALEPSSTRNHRWKAKLRCSCRLSVIRNGAFAIRNDVFAIRNDVFAIQNGEYAIRIRAPCDRFCRSLALSGI
jgi:hypothetical protein